MQSSGRMEPAWYILHTMHANLSEHEVSLNCQLRTAVKKAADDEVEALVDAVGYMCLARNL
jgi:hypothetical protein